jgi:16S rRNA C1402 N4-methylase RsmH
MESTLTTRNVMKELSTGQTIKLTSFEDRMLKRVYDYLAGHCTRQLFLKKIEAKREEVSEISTEVKKNMVSISREASLSENTHDHNHSHSVKSYRVEQRSANEIQTDAMFKAKDELHVLEEKYKNFENQIHKIGFKDIDVLLRKLGVSMPKKNIEVSEVIGE